MKQKYLFPALSLIFILLSFPALADCDCRSEGTTGIPQAECEALLAFYHSAGGANWVYYEDGGEPPYFNRWNNTSPVENWFGVTVEDGHVTGIDFPVYSLSPVGGTIPPEIGNLEFLQVFNIENEFIRGSLPAELGNLTQLKRLWLKGNQIEGSLPPEMGNLTSLEEFSLQYNEVEGPIPPEFANLSNLRVLNLEGNELNGNIPPELRYLENLESLDLTENFLTGIVPPEIGSLDSLKELYLGDNQLEGNIPVELGNLANLEVLSLSRNLLEGAIPEELGNLTNLRILNLGENGLSGPIPPGICSLEHLTGINLKGNVLEGTIPLGLYNQGSLTSIDLSENFLTGTIPAEIGNLTGLMRLNLNNNKLEGSIPAEIGNLTLLEFLNLNSNKLSGAIPPEFANLILLNPKQLGLRIVGSRIGSNALYADDPVIKAYLDDFFRGWDKSQTIAPENFQVRSLDFNPVPGLTWGSNRIKLSWDPIVYKEDDGGYEACIKESAEGLCLSYAGLTHDKNQTSMVVSGLKPNFQYFIDLFAKTYPHLEYRSGRPDNHSTVTSQGSGVVSITSGGTSVTAFPLWEQKPGTFTGLAFSNYGESDTELSLTAWDEGGHKQNIPVNPSQFTVGSGEQHARLGVEYFGAGEVAEQISWIEASSSQLVGSFFTFGSTDMRMLDGAVTQSRPSRRLWFTNPMAGGVLPDAGETPLVKIAMINPMEDPVDLVLRLIKRSEPAATVNRTIPAKGLLLASGEELFGNVTQPAECYLEVDTTAGAGVIGFSRVDFPDAGTTFALNAIEPTYTEILYSAQLASGPGTGNGGMETHIRLINLTEGTKDITFSAIAEDGTPLAEPVTRRLLRGNVRTYTAGKIFDFAGDLAVGSLVIESNAGGVVGDVIFTPFEGVEYAAAMPLQTRPVKEAVFNHIANSEDIYTGLAFFNPGEETAEITIIVAKRGDGTEAGTKQISLAPGHRISRTLKDADMLPGTANLLNGFISISSTQPVICQQLYGSTDLHYLAAVPPTTSYTGMF